MRINWTDNFKDIDVDDTSYRYRKIMGENELILKFSLPEFVEFPLGSYVTFENEVYTLFTPQVFKKNNTIDFEYTLTFGSNQELLKNFKVRDTSGKLVFPFTGKPQEHLKLIVDILNTNNSGWSVGNYLENVEKLISYNHSNCFDALQSIADEFNTEWQIIDKTIHLKKVEYFKETPLPLSYGKGNGFVSGVGRQNENSLGGFNVLFVQGGDRNIDLSVYGNKNLLLPKSQEYVYDGITYQTDADGLSIVKKNVPITFRKEESLDCTHIYPKRTGEVSTFITSNEEKHFYDFTDASIPESLNFNDYMLNGETLTVLFESGMLSGREFEVNYFHADKRFEIVPQELDGITMPDAVFKAQAGDKYSVYGMMLPEAYVSDNLTQTGSSWDMFKEACKYFYENEESKFTFSGKLDGIWAKSDWVNIGGKIKIGSYIRFSDTVFQPDGIDIRIVGVKDYVTNPHSPEIELSNSVQGSNILSELGRVADSNEVVVQTVEKNVIAYTKRRFRDAFETLTMLESAQLDFSGAINPISVNAMSLLVGDKSLQFRFVNSMVNPTGVEHLFSYDTENKVFSTSAGIIQHYTLGIDAIKPEHDYMFWNMAPYVSATMTVPETSYYFYAKVSKLNDSGTFLLSETSIALEQVADYYHLLVGVLNSESDNARSFVKMYGFTEILPGQIKVDTLSSTDGSQFIKLLSDRIEINGNVSFTSTSPALEQAREYTSKTIEVGAHNLILDSAEAKEYYGLSAEKRDRYFDEEKYYTISVDVVPDADFIGYIVLVGRNTYTGNTVLGYEDVSLLADKKRRVKITVKIKLKDFSQFIFTIQDEANTVNLVYTQPKLELGEVSTDWNIAEEDTKKEIEVVRVEAETAKAEVQQEVADVNTSLGNFSTYVTGSFKDGIITQSEAKAIEKYINTLNTEKSDLDAKYNSIYNNASLSTPNKSVLATLYTAYNISHTSLISTINSAIADGVTTIAEKNNVDFYFADYKIKLGSLSNGFENAIRLIEDSKVNTAKVEVTEALNNFEDTVNGSFKDGIITEAEAKAIEKYLNTLNVEKADLTAKYLKVYNNTSLTGTAKTNLLAKKTTFDANHSLLLNSINTAIADGKTTTTEKSDVDTKFANYKTSLEDFTNAYEDAVRFITDSDIAVVDAIATDAQSTANSAQATATGTKDDIAIKLGYTSFTDLENNALLGKTLISGGKINTVLIDAIAVIAKYMSTELLMANSVISNNATNKVNINASSGVPFEVYNSTGVKQLELFEVNGSVQFVYRNKSGNIVWYMGESGVEYAQFTSENWLIRAYRYLGNSKSFSNTSFGIYNASSVGELDIRFNASGTNYYEYVSASNAGTLVRPNEHGNTYTSQNYNGTLIPNGYYYFTGLGNKATLEPVDQNGNPILMIGDVKRTTQTYYGRWYSITVVFFEFGKITERFRYIF